MLTFGRGIRARHGGSRLKDRVLTTLLEPLIAECVGISESRRGIFPSLDYRTCCKLVNLHLVPSSRNSIMQIKVDHLVKTYDGSTSWGDWIERFEIVADFSKWEKDDDRLKMLTLLMDGNAAKIVKQMPDDKRKSYEAVCNRLASAFMPSATEAHLKLTNRKLRTGESVEELFYELKELWLISLQKSKELVAESIQFAAVTPYFLSALPTSVSAQLRLNPATLSDANTLLAAARTLMSIQTQVESTAAIGAFGNRNKPRNRGNKGGYSGNARANCKRCGDKDHSLDECWSQVAVCYLCKQPGHIASRCTQGSGNNPGRDFPPQAPGRAKNALKGRSAGWSDLPTAQ